MVIPSVPTHNLDAALAYLRDATDAFAPVPVLLKPTCDEDGNWRYVPAHEIDGPRALRGIDLSQTEERG